MSMNVKQQQFWKAFLQTNQYDKNTKCFEVFSFGYSKELIKELTHLVLIGQKTATTSVCTVYPRLEDQPKVNDFSLVIDENQDPIAIIQTTSTQIKPFNQVDFEFAYLEGEDENIESWRENHKKFFSEEGQRLNYSFSEDMLVLLETFMVVYQK